MTLQTKTSNGNAANFQGTWNGIQQRNFLAVLTSPANKTRKEDYRYDMRKVTTKLKSLAILAKASRPTNYIQGVLGCTAAAGNQLPLTGSVVAADAGIA